jgi:hypothetical protein
VKRADVNANEYLYQLRDLPDVMVTEAGRSELTRIQAIFVGAKTEALTIAEDLYQRIM